MLSSVFDELNDAYKQANLDINPDLELNMVTYDTTEELESYVNSRAYKKNILCFALSWEEYDTESKTFSLNLRWNLGDVLSPRLPQTEYEESLQNQLYLHQYAHTGFL